MTEEQSAYGLLSEAAESRSPGRLHSSECVLVQPQEPWCTCLSGPDTIYTQRSTPFGETSVPGQILTAGRVSAGRVSSRRDRPLALLLLRQHMLPYISHAH